MPPKKIPKSLAKSIVKNLFGQDPLPSGALSDRINNDPDLPPSMKKTPKQMAYIMNKMKKDHPDLIEEKIMARNGTSHHGTERFRKAFMIKESVTLAEGYEAIGAMRPPKTKENKEQISVMLPPSCISYIKAHRSKGMSAGIVIENLIQADIEANGHPDQEE